ncbi:hypothetical protein AB0M23_21535 [Streptomyces sp. NPDC052077]|uniref:hypothetical protein n=1 Tax=Streptomyces sp. NPDC052077 TaxID=3154757 RepID=UPI00341E294C
MQEAAFDVLRAHSARVLFGQTRQHRKYAEEPRCAEDVPVALARAFHQAAQPPAGPAVVSVSMDDWRRALPGQAWTAAAWTRVQGRTVPAPEALDELAVRLNDALRPALVVGPEADTADGFRTGPELADLLAAPVWLTGWGSRVGLPTGPPPSGSSSRWPPRRPARR